MFTTDHVDQLLAYARAYIAVREFTISPHCREGRDMVAPRSDWAALEEILRRRASWHLKALI